MTKKKNNFRSRFLLLTGVLLVLIGIIFFSYKFNLFNYIKVKSMDWRPYNSSSLGVAFSYPKDYLDLYENENQASLILRLESLFDVKRYKITDSVDDWWAKEADVSENGVQSNMIPADYIKSSVVWNGYPVYFFKLNSNHYQVPMNFYAVKNNGYLYIVSYKTDFPLPDPIFKQANVEFNKIQKPVVAEILKSFRFVNPHFSN